MTMIIIMMMRREEKTAPWNAQTSLKTGISARVLFSIREHKLRAGSDSTLCVCVCVWASYCVTRLIQHTFNYIPERPQFLPTWCFFLSSSSVYCNVFNDDGAMTGGRLWKLGTLKLGIIYNRLRAIAVSENQNYCSIHDAKCEETKQQQQHNHL